MASPAGGGATGVLHDFDRPSGCEKKKCDQKKMTYTTRAGYTSKREEVVHLLARMPNL